MTTRPKTALEAFNSQSASVVSLKKSIGEVTAKAFVTYIVTDLVQSFNVGKTMNDMQVAFAVNGIEGDYYFLKIDELKYCFEQAKKGRYGTMYDRIDAAVIFEWIEKYLTERTQLAYDKNINEQKQFKKLELHPKIASMIQSIIKPIEPVNMDFITPKKRELTHQEIIMQDILKEFDSLPEIEENKAPMKIIKHNGKHFTQSEFLELRLKEINEI